MNIYFYLGLHGSEGFRIRGLEAKGIEAEVASASLPALGDTIRLDSCDEANNERSKAKAGDLVGLLELVNGGSDDLVSKEGSAELDSLAHENADCGEHGNPAVLDLCLAESQDLTFRLSFGEGERVEEAKGGSFSGETLCEVHLEG